MASPVAGLGCIVVGLITGAIGGLGPLFGMMSGLNMRDDTLMLAANSVGGALAYIPIAMLSRRIDRSRLLLFGLGTVAGPIIGGQVMRRGPEHLFSAVAVALALLALALTLDRLRARGTPATMAQAEAAE